MIPTIIAIVVILAIVLAIVIKMIINKKQGKNHMLLRLWWMCNEGYVPLLEKRR